MYCDRRLGGIEKWYFESPPDAALITPPEIRKSIAFVGYADISGRSFLAGSAFLAARTAAENCPFMFWITAKHVIDAIRDKGCDRVRLRLNFSDGLARWIDTPLKDWLPHPSDKSVDVCVYPIRIETLTGTDHLGFQLHGNIIASEALIKKLNIGPGDEVFIAGLFVPHHGKKKNIPIVRIGNIAAMPEEKVDTRRFGPIDAYLIEARSIRGLSGSPVFVHMGFIRNLEGQTKLSPQDYGNFLFLGIMHGHSDSKLTEADEVAEDDGTGGQINVGIGIVVPVSKILEVLNQDAVKELEAKSKPQVHVEGLPKEDALDTDDLFTREDFESALKKVSNEDSAFATC